MYGPDAAALGVQDEYEKYDYGMGVADEYEKYDYGMGFKDDPYWLGQQRFKDDPYWLGRARMRGLFDFLSPSASMSFGTYIDRVNTVARTWADIQAKAAALGPQKAQAIKSLAEQLNVARRTPELVDSVRQQTMDTDKLSKVETRIPVLQKTLAEMEAAPPMPTQDGENERALEYMKAEVDRAIAEKEALLASQKERILGMNKTTFYVVGGTAAAVFLGAATYALTRS